MVNPRFDIKPFCPRFAHHGDQILIANIIFTQKNEMAALAVERMYLIVACARGNIDLAADNGLHPALLGGSVEIDHAIHRAVVCDGDGGLPELLGTVKHRPDAARTVEQAVFCMQMKMGKAGQNITSLRGIHPISNDCNTSDFIFPFRTRKKMQAAKSRLHFRL